MLFIETFNQMVLKHGDRIALAFNGRTMTYSELNYHVNDAAEKLLQQYGLRHFKGSQIAIVMPQCLEYYVTLLAVWKMGSSAVLLHPPGPDDKNQQAWWFDGLLDVIAGNETLARPNLVVTHSDYIDFLEKTKNPQYEPPKTVYADLEKFAEQIDTALVLESKRRTFNKFAESEDSDSTACIVMTVAATTNFHRMHSSHTHGDLTQSISYYAESLSLNQTSIVAQDVVLDPAASLMVFAVGARLEIMPQGFKDRQQYLTFFSAHFITHAMIAPNMAHQICPEDIPNFNTRVFSFASPGNFKNEVFAISRRNVLEKILDINPQIPFFINATSTLMACASRPWDRDTIQAKKDSSPSNKAPPIFSPFPSLRTPNSPNNDKTEIIPSPMQRMQNNVIAAEFTTLKDSQIESKVSMLRKEQMHFRGGLASESDESNEVLLTLCKSVWSNTPKFDKNSKKEISIQLYRIINYYKKTKNWDDCFNFFSKIDDTTNNQTQAAQFTGYCLRLIADQLYASKNYLQAIKFYEHYFLVMGKNNLNKGGFTKLHYALFIAAKNLADAYYQNKQYEKSAQWLQDTLNRFSHLPVHANAFENAKQNLEAFSVSLGIDAAFDANNVCVLKIDNTFMLHIIYEPSTARLYLYTPLFDMLMYKYNESRVHLYTYLLQKTILGSQLGGGIGMTGDKISFYIQLEMTKANPLTLFNVAEVYLKIVEGLRSDCEAIMKCTSFVNNEQSHPALMPSITEWFTKWQEWTCHYSEKQAEEIRAKITQLRHEQVEDSFTKAKKQLAQLGTELGLDNLQFNEDNTCILSVGEAYSLHITFEPEASRLYLYAPLLDKLPQNLDASIILYQTLLHDSFLGAKMAGGGIGLATKENLILMHAYLDLTCDTSTLVKFVPIFIEILEKNQTKYRNILDQYQEMINAKLKKPMLQRNYRRDEIRNLIQSNQSSSSIKNDDEKNMNPSNQNNNTKNNNVWHLNSSS